MGKPATQSHFLTTTLKGRPGMPALYVYCRVKQTGYTCDGGRSPCFITSMEEIGLLEAVKSHQIVMI